MAQLPADKGAKGIHEAAKAAAGGHGLSGKQILGIGAVSGVTSNVVGTQANNSINSKRYGKAKAKGKSYYYRKRNGKRIKVTKSATHGVGYQQNAQAGMPGQPGQGGVY